MARLGFLPVCLVVVVLAGCGGVDGGGRRTPYDVPPSPTPGTPTEDVVRAPPELAAEVNDQESLLGRLESYTLRVNRTTTVSGEVGRFSNRSYRVDRSTGRSVYFLRYLRGQRTGLTTVSVYRGETVFVIKRTPPLGDDARYGTLSDPERSPENASATVFRNRTEVLGHVPLRRNGTAVFDGATVDRYTASGVGSFPGPTDEDVDYRIEVLVDDEGRIRLVAERHVQVSPGGVRFVTRDRLTLTNLDNSTVRPPSWVDTVRAPGRVAG